MALPSFPTAMAMTAVQFGIVMTPVFIYGAVRRSKEMLIGTATATGVGMLAAAILFTPSFGFFASFKFNWLQKLVAFLCVFFLPSVLRIKRTDCGFVLPERPSAWAFGLLVGFLYAAIDVLTTTEHSVPSTEKILFEFSMPGLQEEPLYRGLMLCVFDNCFGRPWKLLGVEFGLGCIVTSVLFAVGHLVMLDQKWNIVSVPDPLVWINMLIFGFAMCWLRYKFNSMWPAVLAHNADNGFAQLGSMLLAKH